MYISSDISFLDSYSANLILKKAGTILRNPPQILLRFQKVTTYHLQHPKLNKLVTRLTHTSLHTDHHPFSKDSWSQPCNITYTWSSPPFLGKLKKGSRYLDEASQTGTSSRLLPHRDHEQEPARPYWHRLSATHCRVEPFPWWFLDCQLA